MVLPIYSVVSISPRVDLTENIGMDWFCIVSGFSIGHPTVYIEPFLGPDDVAFLNSVVPIRVAPCDYIM